MNNLTYKNFSKYFIMTNKLTESYIFWDYTLMKIISINKVTVILMTMIYYLS